MFIVYSRCVMLKIHSFICCKRKDLKATNVTELNEQDNEHSSNTVTQKEYKHN